MDWTVGFRWYTLFIIVTDLYFFTEIYVLADDRFRQYTSYIISSHDLTITGHEQIAAAQIPPLEK